MTIRAKFLKDAKRGEFTGARCELLDGRVVEVEGRTAPVRALARELDGLGYGGHRLQVYTPDDTPSLRGLVFAACGPGYIPKPRDRKRRAA